MEPEVNYGPRKKEEILKPKEEQMEEGRGAEGRRNKGKEEAWEGRRVGKRKTDCQK